MIEIKFLSNTIINNERTQRIMMDLSKRSTALLSPSPFSFFYALIFADEQAQQLMMDLSKLVEACFKQCVKESYRVKSTLQMNLSSIVHTI